ncbi:MAG: dimethylargininase [Acidobacteria bacterium]|nr:MAG: dimethylargininase [Acidobacteriota bacterium]
MSWSEGDDPKLPCIEFACQCSSTHTSRVTDIALTREVSAALARCELTFRPRHAIDLDRAVGQHAAYCRMLESLGLDVVRLPGDPAQPDCCFVEDTAVVLDEVAVLAHPGAPSRRGEVDVVASALEGYRTLARIPSSARLDGGDVLALGRRIFVGSSARTDAAGARALQRIVAPFGYDVVPVGVTGCLHLKSAVTAIGEGAVLANPGWLDLGPFDGSTSCPSRPTSPEPPTSSTSPEA